MVKVAHITTVDLSLRYLLLNQMRCLGAAGYTITGISAPGPDVPVIEEAGIRHLAVPLTRSFTPFADVLALWHLFRLMRREKFTIVHTHTPKPGLLGQLAARLAGVPIVVNTLHGFYFHDGMSPLWRNFYIFMEKVAARCSDVILSQNQEDIQTAIEERICTPEQIKFLGNGIDLELFDPQSLDAERLALKRRDLKLEKSRPVVGFVGRLVAEKGIPELLEAARLVLQEKAGVQFLFVGPIDSSKRDAITPEIAGQYGIAEACTFTGHREDIPDLLSLMDIFVLPSHREGFPRSLMEASAMQVPCIATDIRGCREAVEHTRNGLLVPLGDIQALAAATLQLLENPEQRQSMGGVGRHIAEERFDEKKVFERVMVEYARLLREKGLPLPPPPCQRRKT